MLTNVSSQLHGRSGNCNPSTRLAATVVAMSERTGMSVSQVTDEVLYAGLVEMQEL